MGTGRSRYGAGRPGWRRKCEHMLSIDIRQLHRKGLLRTSSFNSGWTRDGEPSGNVGVQVDPDNLTLRYTWTPSGEEPEARNTAF
jgi:hypothetical protein